MPATLTRVIGWCQRCMPSCVGSPGLICGGNAKTIRCSRPLLVNEAFIRLIDVRQVQWKNRAYFFGAASQMMRRILVDHGRRRQAAKRDGGVTRVELGEAVGATEPRDVDLLALDAALDRLATLDARQSELVVLRFFGGLTLDEAAEVMHISTGTVKRDWTTARAWLHRELIGEPHDA